MTKSMNYEVRALTNSTDDIKNEVIINEMLCNSDESNEIVKACREIEADVSSEDSMTSQLSDESFDEGKLGIHEVAKEGCKIDNFDIIFSLRDEVICEQLKFV